MSQNNKLFNKKQMISKNILIQEINKNKTIKQISESINETYTKTKYWINKYNLKTLTGKHNHIIPNNKQKFINEYNNKKPINELTKLFNVSRNSVKHWLKKYNLKIPKSRSFPVINNHKICTRCKINKPLTEYYFRNKKSQIYRANCKKCQTKCKKENNKLDAIKYKGEKCEICNIKSDIYRIYDFHHKDPTKKEFELSRKRYVNIDKCKDELDKCHLLCSNCHREVHGDLHPNFLQILSIKQPIIKKDEIYKICRKCKINKPLTYYYYGNECKKCHNRRSTLRIRKIKEKCLEYKGGKCQHCEYNKYIGAIDFHHLDPKKKDFRLSKNQKTFGISHKKELDKCIALCSNCHRIEHHRLSKLTKEERIAEYENIQIPKNILIKPKSKLEPKPKLIKNTDKSRKCNTCKGPISKRSKGLCIKCLRTESRVVKNRPSKEQIRKELEELGGYCAVGRKYGVSDNCIRKWLK